MDPGKDLRATLPFLVRMAIPQRTSPELPSRYDPDRDELLVLIEESWVPAVDSPRGGPKTKKHDVEIGEDQKDRWR
jgi:hypothetical protein